MAYVAPIDLLQTPGALELAQVATPDHKPIVAAELLVLLIEGGDLTGQDLDAIAIAEEALARIESVIVETEQLIDGYLVARYTLPLNPVPKILGTWALDITRYRLHKNLQDDKHPIALRYRDALKFLGEVRDGKFSLGIADPIATAPQGEVRVDAPRRVFTSDTLRDY